MKNILCDGKQYKMIWLNIKSPWFFCNMTFGTYMWKVCYYVNDGLSPLLSISPKQKMHIISTIVDASQQHKYEKFGPIPCCSWHHAHTNVTHENIKAFTIAKVGIFSIFF